MATLTLTKPSFRPSLLKASLPPRLPNASVSPGPLSVIASRSSMLLPPEVTPHVSTEGVPQVYGEMLITMINDLQELVSWWQERKATPHQASDEENRAHHLPCRTALD